MKKLSLSLAEVCSRFGLSRSSTSNRLMMGCLHSLAIEPTAQHKKGRGHVERYFDANQIENAAAEITNALIRARKPIQKVASSPPVSPGRPPYAAWQAAQNEIIERLARIESILEAYK